MSWLKEQLNKRNMTQKELAIRTGITEAAISRYINGTRKMRVETCVVIAKVLGIKLDIFIKGILKKEE